ncbi:GNAT family N-acetyltransferase [Flavobacterium piscinae]|uniref:GNAT family N-acetyltransferase n=1 Tax=Flavobacterium piscinae TaxID=2506424 RepID=A0A4Q1KLV2_9FLAO|nr:GNAT family N-acetyltransferase [Flavobacterium piscinae]MBC8882936.1 GNAT family N-acetyltransferase [Flavobacterium piscinae]RXR30139.1 GNAT family N-acetyltransferase [Flavobacterium piscinae]
MITIRPIQKADNEQIASVIRSVLIEHDVPKVGTAYADVSLDSMFETYSLPRSHYFVVENKGKIIGGAGISQLENESETICELQKMYFLPEARGIGVGSEMMTKCLAFAQSVGFKKCYLETMPYMHAAQKLYLKFGFHYIDAPLGCTGHTSCPVWMLKEL